jgi:FAD:protein FMN transferase
MTETRIMMGMPITVSITHVGENKKILDDVFNYFTYIDETFSTYKDNSEITKINNGKIKKHEYSNDMQKILTLCEDTKTESNGYFDIKYKGKLDPSGLVKGWAIYNASQLVKKAGYYDYFVEAGGDIQASGKNKDGKPWRVGIKNPFKQEQIIKIVALENNAIATSGTYIRGQHIYNPLQPEKVTNDIVSASIIGPNIYDADRYATAAFAMGNDGLQFITTLHGFEAYIIYKDGEARYTKGFERYVVR